MVLFLLSITIIIKLKEFSLRRVWTEPSPSIPSISYKVMKFGTAKSIDKYLIILRLKIPPIQHEL